MEVPDLKNGVTEKTKESEKTKNSFLFVFSVSSVAPFLRSGTSVRFVHSLEATALTPFNDL